MVKAIKKIEMKYYDGQKLDARNRLGVDLIFTMVSTTYRHTIAGM